MDLKSTQLKDTYGNLLTIGTVAGSPTTGTLENGDGEDITALDVAGTITADGLTVDGNATIGQASGADRTLSIGSVGAFHFDIDTEGATGRVYLNATNDATAGKLHLQTADLDRLFINNNGDISFYEDTGTTPALFWDASEARLGIGTDTPARTFHVSRDLTSSIVGLFESANSEAAITLKGSGTTNDVQVRLAANGDNLLAYAGGTERMRIDSSGNVGIGGTAGDGYRLQLVGPSEAGNTLGMTYAGVGAAAIKVNSSGALEFGLDASDGNTERMRIDSDGNLLVGATATPTSSAGNIVLNNGTAPTGNATNGVILYAEDVSTSSELKVRDEAGNVTTLSPHNFSLIPDGASEEMAWAYYSERDGKKINVDMLKLARMVESLTGEKLVYEQ